MIDTVSESDGINEFTRLDSINHRACNVNHPADRADQIAYENMIINRCNEVIEEQTGY
jgi:hypothetical protein